MMTDREKRPIVMRVNENHGLDPVGPMDRDAMLRYPIGHHVNVTAKQRRSNLQQGAYWEGLQRAVEATEAYPTSEHLHEAIKWELGYLTPVKRFDGKIYWIPDSTAFGAMDRGQFNDFFGKARKLVIERMGFDPWAFLDEKKREAA